VETNTQLVMKHGGIMTIIFKTPSFDLLEDVKKKFGVVFTPNTPIVEVEKTIKRLYATKHNKKPQTISKVFQGSGSDKVHKREIEKIGD